MSTPAQEPKWRHLPLREAYPFGADHELDEEISAIREDQSYRSGLRRGLIVELFQTRGILQPFIDTCWPHGNTSEGKRFIRRYLTRVQDYHDTPDDVQDDYGDDYQDQTVADQQFAYESDLRDFLADNLTTIEPGLELFQDEERDGVEYPVRGGRIDILAKDGTGRAVVIELKVSRGRNPTIGQLLYYMSWIDENLSNQGKKSRGIIIAKEISDDLRMACERLPDVSLYEYTLSVQLQKV